MLFGTTGVIRSGKTTLNTVLAALEAENPDSEVYANYHINHKRIKYLDTIDDFMELNFDKMNGLCVLQEVHVWLESRGSGSSAINKMLDKIVLQSGKLGFDILWDAQLGSSVDKRLRFMTLNWFATRRKIMKPNLVLRYIYLNERNQIFKFNFSDESALKRYVFPLFDTRELAELKRRKDYNSTETSKLDSPDGDKIAKETPDIPEHEKDITKILQGSGITELISYNTKK